MRERTTRPSKFPEAAEITAQGEMEEMELFLNLLKNQKLRPPNSQKLQSSTQELTHDHTHTNEAKGKVSGHPRGPRPPLTTAGGRFSEDGQGQPQLKTRYNPHPQAAVSNPKPPSFSTPAFSFRCLESTVRAHQGCAGTALAHSLAQPVKGEPGPGALRQLCLTTHWSALFITEGLAHSLPRRKRKK